MITLLLAALACTDDAESDLSPACDETATELALDEESPLGFTAQSLLDTLPISSTHPFDYDNGDSTSITLAVTPSDSATYVDSEPAENESGNDIYVICEDRLEVAAGVYFDTYDGVFQENVSVALVLTDGRIDGLAALDLGAMGGSFDIDDFTEEQDWDEARASIEFQYVDGSGSGRIYGDVSGEDDCEDDDNCSAWDALVPVGSWDGTLVTCVDATGEYLPGESWTCPDGCNTCGCEPDGSIWSTDMVCE